MLTPITTDGVITNFPIRNRATAIAASLRPIFARRFAFAFTMMSAATDGSTAGRHYIALYFVADKFVQRRDKLRDGKRLLYEQVYTPAKAWR